MTELSAVPDHCAATELPVAVIGAGVIGTMTAQALIHRGHRVVLIDALDGPAEMCSHANAGVMAVGHAEAWAGPQALPTMLQALTGRDPAVRITRLMDPALWIWGLAFLKNCTARAHATNSERMRRLSFYSRNLLAKIEAELGLPPETRHDGGLYLFQDKVQFRTRADGLTDPSFKVLSRDQLLEIEPALAKMGDRLKGGIFSHTDSVGDCRLFTQRAVTALSESNRLETRFRQRVTGLHRTGGRIVAVETDCSQIDCSAVVLATGVETAQLTRPLGFTPIIYPVKGYSGTWQVREPACIPTLPFVDETELLAVASYGGILRVTAIAEFDGQSRSLPAERTRMLGDYVRRSFGDAVDHCSVAYWTGLRPTTPSGPPYLGRVKHFQNLWINAGHGQLGWTMSFGCAELIAQAMAGQPTDIKDVSARASWLEEI